MIEINPLKNDIKVSVLIKLVEDLSSFSGIKNETKPYVSVFKSLWIKHLSCGTLFNPISFNSTQSVRYFPLEHYIDNYFIVSCFSVDVVNILLSKGVLHKEIIPLSDVVRSLHYNETNSLKLFGKYLEDPIIAVIMPSFYKDHATFYEIIDGNHRISAAIRSNMNLPVTCIQDMFIPPIAFATDVDWITYHIVQGFSLLVGQIQDAESYVGVLKMHLERNYPI